MRRVFPAVWPSTRAISVFVAIAAVLAFASAFPVLILPVVVAFTVFVAAIVADAAIGPRPRALEVSREPVPLLALGRTATLEYTIRNRGSVALHVGIIETPIADVDSAASVVALIPARSELTVSLTIVPRERGNATFGALYIWSENPLRLLRRRFRTDASIETVRVFPDLSIVESSGRLANRKTLIAGGLRRTRRRGGGTEFESLRDHVPGDGFRFIDWKATARRGRMTVAQYDVERSQNVIVALDCGRLMTPRVGRVRKLDHALTAALAVGRIAENAGDNVGLEAFAARPIVELAPRRGTAHYRALARAVYDLQPRLEEPDYESVFSRMQRRHRKRSLIVLFTDIFDPVTSAAVLAGLGRLVPQHVAMCVLLSDAAIETALADPPHDRRTALRTSVAITLADERAKAIAILRGRGIIVVDVPADRLTVALMDAYLDVKARGLL